MCLRVDAFSNWWVFESLCVSNLLCLRVVSVSVYSLLSAKPSLQAPSTKVCFFARLCVSKVTYILAVRAVNFYNIGRYAH